MGGLDGEVKAAVINELLTDIFSFAKTSFGRLI
jgi:hypothetical protein